MDRLIDQLIGWLIGYWLIDWSIDLLVDGLIDWSIDQSIGWLIDWLIDYWLIATISFSYSSGYTGRKLPVFILVLDILSTLRRWLWILLINIGLLPFLMIMV